MLRSFFILLALGGAALAAEPDRQAVIKRLGPFPRAGTFDQKSIWCQDAIIVARGSYSPEHRTFVIFDDHILSTMRDRCVANSGAY